jgi:predicted aspartyl protease
MSVAYQSVGYLPPIPILAVRFRRLVDPVASELYDAIVDTGADMTIAPAEILVNLQAHDVQETNLVSQWGDVHPVVLYLVDLEIEGQVIPGVLVAGDETTQEVILGRNLLNMLPLFLDGPQQQTYVVEDARARQLRMQR